MKDYWQNFIREKHIEYIDLKYPDLTGQLHHVTLPATRFDSLLGRGVGFDASSVPGFRQVESGDMLLRPDLTGAFLDPFFDRPTLSFFAELHDPRTGARFVRDPRHIALAAEQVLTRELGLTRALFLPEFEFYLFDRASFGETESSSFYACAADGLPYAPTQKNAYHQVPPRDASANFRSELMRLLGDAGIKVKYHHHEVGTAAQVEIELGFDNLARVTDAIVIVKYVIHNAAARAGTFATFMPKPLPSGPGNGMHFHIYFLRGEQSFFGTRGTLTAEGGSFIAGVLEHAPALCAFTNPTTNSYRRLCAALEAPTHAFYSTGNRTAAVRIPGYLMEPNEMRIEYRPPDGLCNPFLGPAALALAGLDGVRRGLRPHEPIEEDVRTWPPERRAGLLSLPRTLEDALDCLDRDHEFLNGIFDEGLIPAWRAIKEREVNAVATRPHPYEHLLYFAG